ncbi:LPXTG cell wall anchor domain-containing protein [Candidatus Enterococcus mansonii]|uniref:Gram-positive cocci surface proteins LPxTG domain-containing protein n=1 Tax=Candidatus Enterococcus mansonii TaxID=1834181 RepID=A0A242CHW6_9ENTE|nr:LPXTG cell wall anchor domain-containing protein [Enterococcus sp. 4G2_DIV0659]OTO09827.1 hypothetical protein A5880_000510 [Enterococcus sp. 4G2_DIV0659]
MMKLKHIFLLAASISMGVLLVINPIHVEANSEQKINSNGSISFILDEEYEKQLPNTEGNSINNTNNGTAQGATKPIGRYPNTGEVVKKSMALSGGALIAISLFIYWNRRKRHG